MVLALVAANGFFTAAEFALISVERSTIESMADSGNRRASLTLAMLRRLSFYLSGAQLGISLTALGLGFVAAPVAGELIEPLVDSVLGEPSPGLSVAVALVLATIFQTVMGELVPKIIAIAKPVRVALTLALPYRIVMSVMSPVVHVLDRTAAFLVGLMGIEPTEEMGSGRSLDELEYLVKTSGEGGTLNQEDARLLMRSIHFGEKLADDVLTPRLDVVSISENATLNELTALSTESGFSRFPVIGDSLDQVRGIALIKSVFEVPYEQRAHTSVLAIKSDALLVPEGRSLESLLAELRARREHMALVIDEHGGTAGVVTVEDLVEEVVGEIDDEHDDPELTVVRHGNVVILAASLHPDEVLEACGFEIPDGDYETLAGFALVQLQRVPREGEVFIYEGWRFQVVEMDRRRIASLRMQRVVETLATEGEQS